MKINVIKYNILDLESDSKKMNRFKQEITIPNVIYFFCNGDDCLYIGESKISLHDRCFVNSPKHRERPWFKESDTIYIIKLGDSVDDFTRGALESVLICTFRPKYNQKA